MATGVLAYITEILRTGKNLIFSDQQDRLPAAVEATLPKAINKNVKGGVAALNGDGLPVDVSGRPMAVIGEVAGTAADAQAVADDLAVIREMALDADGNADSRVLALGVVKAIGWTSTAPTEASLQAQNVPSGTLIVSPGA